ncbi:MAG: galactokinase [Candidatus Hydrogenedentes bacterium]|nr:galactokinase [Candidatus Hydrogenedentota bacterium]
MEDGTIAFYSNTELIDCFSSEFGGPPQILTRAPGRVNLLGEHVDYNGLPVLPMTIDRAVTIAARKRDDHSVTIRNLDNAFAGEAFENVLGLPHSAQGSWINYCKAAMEGINTDRMIESFPGMNILCAGTIPPASGLSSSSALVVATALTYLSVLEQPLRSESQRTDLAALLAGAERYVGVHGGGMDQAIILLGGKECACKINFFPLRVERVPVFRDHLFVICNSLVKADKSGSAVHRYNEGPLTCRLIRALAEKHAQMAFGEEIEIEHLGDLWFGPLCLTNAEVESLFSEAFPQPRTTLAQATAVLGIGEAEIRRKWLGDLPEPDGGYNLQARARHQLTELARVEQGRDCLLAGDAATFGSLMNDSHQSCAHDYGVSSPQLDTLVEVARQAGALGSRLTGAGFGGCTVSLIEKDSLESFANAIATHYYEEYLNLANADPLAQDWVLPAQPVSPADSEYL